MSIPQEATYLNDIATQCVDPTKIHTFYPDSIHLLDSFAFHRDTLVEVACKERSSGCYHGNDESRQSVKLKFGDFVEYYQASFKKEAHWLQTVNDLDFYLAQCPIAMFKSDVASSKASLPRIMNDFLLPTFLEGEAVTRVNLWMTVKPSQTTLHYDAYQNLLVVLYGRKKVTLYSPPDMQKMYPFPIYSKSANHSQVNIIQPDLEKHSQFLEASAHRFEIMAGDALIIPEGWWHQVDSDEYTIAVNYWWNGMREKLVADKQMVPYYARVLLEELVKQCYETRLLALQRASENGYKCDNESCAVAAFLAANNQAERERLLMSLDSTTFAKVQEFLASSHEKEWRKLLSNASVDFAAVLTNSWERDELDDHFLNALFSALESEEETIKEELANKQAQFRRTCAMQMYQLLFG